jgi:hypothetical protein
VLLGASSGTTDGQRIILQVDGKDSFILWLSTVGEKSPWTFQDGLNQARKFFKQDSEPSSCFLYTMDLDLDEEQGPDRTRLVSILNLGHEASASVDISFQDWHELAENKSRRSAYRRAMSIFGLRNSFLLVAAIILISMIILVLVPGSGSKEAEENLWLHWNIGNSEGLQHQLQFTKPWPSFSEWTESTLHENIDWFVRIDDQSMCPSHLVDESEIKYQK